MAGGGGGQREATPEERRLWQEQAEYLSNLRRISMPALTTGMNNLMYMANEAMSNVLSDKLRSFAEQDAIASAGAAQNYLNKYLSQYGINPNSGAFADMNRQLAVDFAAKRAANMNAANMAAEDTKWNRSSNLVSLASGQGQTAVSGLSNLSGQLATDRRAGSELDAHESMGRGMMAAYLTKNILGFKDGGPVPGSGGLRYYAPSFSSPSNPYSFSSSSSKPSTFGSIAQPMALALSAEYAKPLLRGSVEQVKNFLANQVNGLTSVPVSALPEQTLTLAAQNAPFAEGATQLGTLAAQDAAFLPASQAGSALTAGTAEALGATGAAEAAAAASGLGAISSALPWIGAGYLLGSLFGLWRDGGPVKGPGDGDVDTVPAMLANKEYVVNSKATGLRRKETMKLVNEWKQSGGSTRDLLDKINRRGLDKRYGKE